MTGTPGRTRDTAVAVVATTREVLARPELREGEGLLAPWERRRLAGIRLPSRRDDVVASRLLVRLCVARFTGLPPAESTPAQLCPDCGRHGHGRPYLPGRPGVGVSLSHADGLVAAAVGPGPVGIDVEPSTRRPGPPRILRRLLSETEFAEAVAQPDPGPALLRLWVRREARLKAGRDDLRLVEWTDRDRAAVVTVAGTTATTIFTVATAASPEALSPTGTDSGAPWSPTASPPPTPTAPRTRPGV
ncbi:4'-phosphopantetheinyl transferase family protein [Streptomyces zaomyceticus]|uniref:4'-phosphopantetheinyl transferase family protein n=1 Tax=Streptomyces zaomyceticus TaxID=68286 RepID=UPI002E1209F3|nr:4'-phosphopantetheinyl transferase superfamily protein [Streptomyces zaomyceticus]